LRTDYRTRRSRCARRAPSRLYSAILSETSTERRQNCVRPLNVVRSLCGISVRPSKRGDICVVKNRTESRSARNAAAPAAREMWRQRRTPYGAPPRAKPRCVVQASGRRAAVTHRLRIGTSMPTSRPASPGSSGRAP
jgi:hypothetical protein